MTATAIIPARLGSTRFPEKVLARETGRFLIQHVAEAAAKARTVGRVVVATDSDLVMAAVCSFGGEALMTSPDHPNGSSRLAEAARLLGLPPDAIVVNVQGDEPEIEPDAIDLAVSTLTRSGAPAATLASPLTDPDQAREPHVVKVVTSLRGDALYFSRAPIPAAADNAAAQRLRHIGLYVYRRSFLETYAKLEPTPLEQAEKLEQLRVLEHGYRMAVGLWTGPSHPGIDTPEQYDAFVSRWKTRR